MARKDEILLPLHDARKMISDFFGGNIRFVEVFANVAEHLVKSDSEIIVRASLPELIGLSKPHELFRFYVIKENDSFYIKYKHLEERELLDPSSVDSYYVYNEECNAFFARNNEFLIRSSARREMKRAAEASEKKTRLNAEDVLVEWGEIKTKAVLALSLQNMEIPKDSCEAVVFDEIIRLLKDACVHLTGLSDRSKDILLNRLLEITGVTLQKLGNKYGVCRERVRQVEKSAWRSLTNGIYQSSKSEYSLYRTQLINLLAEIPEEEFIYVLFRIKKRHPALGTWLIKISSPCEKKRELNSAVKEFESIHNLAFSLLATMDACCNALSMDCLIPIK